MRKLLFFAALCTVRKGGIMHVRYQKYLKKGMIKMKALIAIARKLLCIIFALASKNRNYDIDYAKAQNLEKIAA